MLQLNFIPAQLPNSDFVIQSGLRHRLANIFTKFRSILISKSSQTLSGQNFLLVYRLIWFATTLLTTFPIWYCILNK